MSGNNLVLAGSAGGPPPPTGLLATSITNTQFTLSWDNSTITGVTYKVYKAGVEVVGATTYSGSTIGSLTGNTTYAMKVRAYLGSAYTDSAVYNVLTTPNAPTGLAFSSATQSSFVLSWTNVSGLTYTIYKDATLLSVTASYTGTTINAATGISPMNSNSSFNMYVYATNASGSTSSAVLVAYTIPDAPVYSATGNIRSNSAYIQFTSNGGYFSAWVGSSMVPVNISISVLSSVSITNTTGSFSFGGIGNNTSLAVGSKITVTGTNSGPGTISGYSNPTSYYVVSSTYTTFTLSTVRGSSTGVTTSTGLVTGLTFTYFNDATQLSSVTINGVTNGWFTTTTSVYFNINDTVYVYGTSPGTITGYSNPTTYYVVSGSTSTFQLSTSLFGTPITTTASGSTSGLSFFYIPTYVGSPNGFTISNLSPAVNNTIYVKATNQGGTATSAALTVRAAPSPPTSFVVEPNNTCTFVLFNTPYDPYGVINAYSLKAYSSNTDNTSLQSSKCTATTVSPVCVTGLTNGTNYYYTLTACTATGSTYQSYETGPSIVGMPTVTNACFGTSSTTITITNSVLCSSYGWDGIKAVDVYGNSGTRICSTNANPAMCFCVTMPARKLIRFLNYAVVTGCGGKGGKGGGTSGGYAGAAGGPGISVAYPLTIHNWCVIGGGGGGGGGGNGWHGGGGGGGGGIPNGAGCTGGPRTTGTNYAGSTSGASGTGAAWNASYSYWCAGHGGNGGYGRAIGAPKNPGSNGCFGSRTCTNTSDVFCISLSGGGYGGSRGGNCSTGGYGGGGGGGGASYGGTGGTAGTARGQCTPGGGPAGGAGGSAVIGNTCVTWAVKGSRGGALV